MMNRLALYAFVLVDIAICPQLCFSADNERPYVVIHRQGDFGCHTFRIPGIAKTNDGTLLAVYDMRYTSRRDLQAHIDIGLSRSTDGG
ncbi:MAG: glycoside hydrolase, partial [Pirellulales bacterium]|nr:glycoside hydrolase [Pirellulales bacterium]